MSACEPAKIAPAEWELASAQRSRLYGWFSALYAEEVQEALFEKHFSGGSFEPFEGVSALGLAGEVRRLEAAITALHDVPLARLELAADFAQLFLLDARSGALPYASAYEGDASAARLYSAAEAKMRELLASRALAICSTFREPADHLAVLLSLQAHLAQHQCAAGDIHAAAQEQADLLRTALLNWLPRFVARCQQVKPRFDFYPALATLLLGFMRADLSFLEDLATD
ncbi:MAG: molecular chaperone TorD [Thauera sp.]|nr:molecular chaperone TorD [Thauera sp.]